MKRKWRTIAVAMASAAIAFVMLLFRGSGEAGTSWHPWDGPTIQRDLDAILRDTLRVLVMRDPLVWEERQRVTTGLEYELLQRFARRMECKLAVQCFDDPDSLLSALWQGHGDIAAGQWTLQKEWQGYFSASPAYAVVQPVVTCLRPPLPGLEERPDSLPLSSGSPFAQVSQGFWKSLRTPVTITRGKSEDDLLLDVVLGKSKAVLISDLRAAYEAERFPILEFSEAVGPQQELSFVVRTASAQLLAALSAWMDDRHETEAREHLMHAYVDRVPPPGPLRSRKAKGLAGDSISPFDAHFREHAAVRGWRWELLAAVAWKETRFDSTVTSHKGAKGIMQFMPATAERLGLDSTSSMKDHIQAAARYLSRLDTIWLRAVPDKEQRLRFVLASYNAGPGHIIDAQRLAERLGLDPGRWEDNVERAVLLLAKPRFFLRPEMKNGYCKGSQVFHYVRGVLTVYDQLCRRSAKR